LEISATFMTIHRERIDADDSYRQIA